jgi:error-prone DNA polymerase
MGFYAPDTLAHEAQRKGIELIAPDVNLSGEECTVDDEGRIRLGLNYVLGARSAELAALVEARDERSGDEAAGRGRSGPFRSLADLASRAGAGRAILDRLAWAGTCDALAAAETDASQARRTALWRLGVAAPGTALKDGTQLALPLELPGAPALGSLSSWDAMVADYATTSLTLGPHPVALLRPDLPAGAVSTRDLETLRHETPVTIGGLVVARQRPGTAKGIVFILLEDEFGTVNLIVPPPVYERHRLTVRSEPLLLALGRLEKLPIAGGAINIYVRDLRALAEPGSGGAGVVPLPERGDPADAREAVPALAAVGAGAEEEAPVDGALADFRGVAPAVQSFAAGRRR